MTGITLTESSVVIQNGAPVTAAVLPSGSKDKTIADTILRAHNVREEAGYCHVRFDAMISHDITYVGIIQTARASGMKQFPLPYALTNCHNSLCAVGGTINEDDHAFGLSAAKKYGGIYVPANQSVIHSYAREALAGCGKMILGSDSHTRYGALGTMGIGEGGPELVKQLLRSTYDVPRPEVVLVWLEGAPRRGIGPHDVALALVGATFGNEFVKNRVLEFAGPGVANLSVDFRCGIDVMTTESACLSSVWTTDDQTKAYYETMKRPQDYKKLSVQEGAGYDRMITIRLDEIESMIALPFHPSNAYTIHEFNANAKEILAAVEADAKAKYPKAAPALLNKVTDKGVMAEQGVIAGCAGGIYENVEEAAAVLHANGGLNNPDFTLSVYPTSVPVSMALTKNGTTAQLLADGAVIKPSFCGPCFGAGDVPCNNGLSLRHTTRNFPNREGSKPGEGQIAYVALMDARSIAATAANGGIITAATDVDHSFETTPYFYDDSAYTKRVYDGYGHPQPETELVMGPNITDWPRQYALCENVLLKPAAVLHDAVTTTDELIPSGETSSYRSNPLRLSEFALSRREPQYVSRAKATAALEKDRRDGKTPQVITDVLSAFGDAKTLAPDTQVGSCLFAEKPGDGSAREQAASCQKVLGGLGNICHAFATKRYRSNCINWGILPFTMDAADDFPCGTEDWIFVPHVRAKLLGGEETFPAEVLCADGSRRALTLYIHGLTEDEKEILLDGCLMNYYAAHAGKD